MNLKPNPLISAVLLSSLTLCAPFSKAQAEVEATKEMMREIVTLDPVIADGTPADALKFDPVVPSLKAKTTLRASNGGIAKDLSNSIPYHFSDNTRAGNVVNFSGAVKAAEEVDVNVMGIPLNAPQGGGFNLTSFPQYIWNGFNFQVGPALGAYDPRGVAGSLSLRLWTQEALFTEESGYRITGFHSTSHVQQLSVGYDNGKDLGILAGMSTGKVQGPAGSVSYRAYESGRFKSKIHLIATDQKVQDFQSERSTQATADYRTVRFIPIVQADYQFTPSVLLKTNFFYDDTYLETDDPTNATGVQHERSHIMQGGVETALISGKTKIGLGVRQVDFNRLTFTAPRESILNLQATHTIKSGEYTLDPTIGATAITRFGLKPMATLGIRRDITIDESSSYGNFLRIGYHNRFPSLIDRYTIYVIPGFSGLPYAIANPGLDVEKVISSELGADYHSSDLNASITAFARFSKDTRYYQTAVINYAGPPTVTRSGKVINYGDSYTFGILPSVDYRALPVLTLGAKVNWTKARYETAHEAVLYQPEWVGILTADLHDSQDRYGFTIIQKLATSFLSGSEESTAFTRLPGYGYVDLSARAKFTDSVSGSLGVENVFDRKIQFRKSQPTQGRIYVMSATGVF